jgi:integrase
MRGSVVKRKSSWTFVVDYGVDVETGKRRQIRRSGFRTRKEAEAALRKTIDTLTEGTYVERSTETVGEYLARWLETLRLSQRVRPTTVKSYRESLARLLPLIGAVPLQALRPVHVEEAYAVLLSRDTHKGKPPHPGTVVRSHRALHKALVDAERLGLVARNVARHVLLPTVPAPSNASKVWTADQLRQFLEATRNDALHAAYVLAATTGMRRGEVAALRWQDIDLDNARLRVEQSVSTVYGVLVFNPPKTKKGVRTIALDAGTVAVMRSHRVAQAERRLALGSSWVDTGRVFTREDGTLLHPDVLSNRFDAQVAMLDLPRITIHGLRHTWATLALEKGIHPKIVSERLGHSTIAITLDIYSRVLPRMDADAASAVAGDLFAP